MPAHAASLIAVSRPGSTTMPRSSRATVAQQPRDRRRGGGEPGGDDRPRRRRPPASARRARRAGRRAATAGSTSPCAASSGGHRSMTMPGRRASSPSGARGRAARSASSAVASTSSNASASNAAASWSASRSASIADRSRHRRTSWARSSRRLVGSIAGAVVAEPVEAAERIVDIADRRHARQQQPVARSADEGIGQRPHRAAVGQQHGRPRQRQRVAARPAPSSPAASASTKATCAGMVKTVGPATQPAASSVSVSPTAAGVPTWNHSPPCTTPNSRPAASALS